MVTKRYIKSISPDISPQIDEYKYVRQTGCFPSIYIYSLYILLSYGYIQLPALHI